jgi:hypothetical protein
MNCFRSQVLGTLADASGLTWIEIHERKQALRKKADAMWVRQLEKQNGLERTIQPRTYRCTKKLLEKNEKHAKLHGFKTSL